MRSRAILAALLLLACTASQSWAQAAVGSPSDSPPDAGLAPIDDGPQPGPPPDPDQTPALGVAPGVSGQVVLEGRCPVPLGGDEPCPDRPFPTTVLIRADDVQQPVTSVQTAGDGTFAVPLAPGRYHVDSILVAGIPRAVSPIVVDVASDGVVPVMIRVPGGVGLRKP
jgi:hypothetical protein